jgi:Domain of unknown function (DUF5668)
MNCSTHPDATAVAFCRACGKALCADCRRVAEGTVYCAEHAPSPSTTAYTGQSAPPGNANPALAFVLGFIPGVGAIYNGQYAKGLVHAIIFGLLVSILDSHSVQGVEPLFGILLGAFVLYMPFEAYHTARKRNAGQPVDEFSSMLQPHARHSSAGAVTLIIVGTVFLLNTLGIVEMHQILRFWPVLLIALGISMLHSRISEAGSANRSGVQQNREVNHERR